MRGLLQDDAAFAADAYLAWWRLAGVDGAVGDAPVNWLRPVPARTDAGTGAVSGGIPPAAPVTLPKDFETFLAWLKTDSDQMERQWPSPPIMPIGPADAPLMIITDMPDSADVNAGHLLADRAGALFDAMLRALGYERAGLHIASLFFARPPGGMVEARELDRAAARMRLHVRLARPRRLLLLGDRTIRALLPADGSERGDGLRAFNHDGGTVNAAATFHPRLLLGQPAAKAECWQILQSLIEENRP
ncbi:DNA polymerase [Sphingobium sp. OAS761]|uniref:uracil-DNA glycosylase family protein n=1 Tax=Sphingobium sp. OAS761 TaxID=2817901 RepID=UPI0020A0B325|nr:uracil-DNA glycosylase family protein [Sphingobium sp. OAS761]MCP1471007.1 DNA polymerase [Sphingobium sp. OAS761]